MSTNLLDYMLTFFNGISVIITILVPIIYAILFEIIKKEKTKSKIKIKLDNDEINVHGYSKEQIQELLKILKTNNYVIVPLKKNQTIKKHISLSKKRRLRHKIIKDFVKTNAYFESIEKQNEKLDSSTNNKHSDSLKSDNSLIDSDN